MINYANSELSALTKKQNIRLINSLLGGKPAQLIGTACSKGRTNLAIFNSACHVSSDPARLGIMSRPLTVPRDTFRNIQETGVWTMNAVTPAILQQAHATSEKLPPEESEFDATGLNPHWHKGFTAPFVAESPIKIGMKWLESVPIQCSETVLIIGEVVQLHIHSMDWLASDGSLLPEKVGMLSSLGLDAYASVTEVGRFEYGVSNPCG